MDTNVKMVTPELASKLLEANTKNRALGQKLVAKYAREMAEGRWQWDNGESIKIDIDGRVIDGQHRLHAIISSGIPTKMLIISGLPRESFATIDTGKSRTGGDIASIAGIANANQAVAAAQIAIQLINGKAPSPDSNARPTRGEVHDFVVHNNESLQEAMHFIRQSSGAIVSRSLLAGVLYAIQEKSRIADADRVAKSFFTQLQTGQFDDYTSLAKHPAYLMRERLIQNRTARTKIRQAMICALLVKAWNAYAKKAPVGVLRFQPNKDEAFPEIF